MRPPATLWLYALVWLVFTGVDLAMYEDARTALGAIALSVIALLLIALLRGSRVAWVLFVVFEAVGLVAVAFDEDPWLWVPVSAAALALLLARPTRQYVSGAGTPPKLLLSRTR